jgi:aconitate hydratase
VIAPRYLGLRVVIAKSFARIHGQNLANFGVLPLQFTDPGDYDHLQQGDVLTFTGLHEQLSAGQPVIATTRRGDRELRLSHQLSERQIGMILAGGRIPLAARDARVSDPGDGGHSD